MKVILLDKDMNCVGGILTTYLRHRMLVDLTILASQYREVGYQLISPVKAMTAWEDSDGALVVFSDFRLMMVTAGAPWFASDVVLYEEWIGQGVTTDDAIKAMKAIAPHIGATKISVGTRATPGQRHEAAARLYQRQGLRPSTITLEGDVNERSQESS